MQKSMEKRKIVVIWEFILHFSIWNCETLTRFCANTVCCIWNLTDPSERAPNSSNWQISKILKVTWPKLGHLIFSDFWLIFDEDSDGLVKIGIFKLFWLPRNEVWIQPIVPLRVLLNDIFRKSLSESFFGNYEPSSTCQIKKILKKLEFMRTNWDDTEVSNDLISQIIDFKIFLKLVLWT